MHFNYSKGQCYKKNALLISAVYNPYTVLWLPRKEIADAECIRLSEIPYIKCSFENKCDTA